MGCGLPVAALLCGLAAEVALAQAQLTVVPTVVKLSASPDVGISGQRVTLTASVTVVDGGEVPDGTIEFIEARSNRLLGRIGVARPSIFLDHLPVGHYAFRAEYSGVQSYFPFVIDPSRSNTVNYTVRAVPEVLLSSSQNPSSLGQAVTLTAVVRSPSGTPKGAVTFQDQHEVMAERVQLDSNGVAAFTTSALAEGSRAILARYEGDAVNAAAVSVHLVQDVGSAHFHNTVLFRAPAPQHHK
jgi:hypothetical protein